MPTQDFEPRPELSRTTSFYRNNTHRTDMTDEISDDEIDTNVVNYKRPVEEDALTSFMASAVAGDAPHSPVVFNRARSRRDQSNFLTSDISARMNEYESQSRRYSNSLASPPFSPLPFDTLPLRAQHHANSRPLSQSLDSLRDLITSFSTNSGKKYRASESNSCKVTWHLWHPRDPPGDVR